MLRYRDLAVQLAARHGEGVGIAALGYPTSWCHTKAEIDKVKELLQGATRV